jgi:hypothetical protein
MKSCIQAVIETRYASHVQSKIHLKRRWDSLETKI